jgi:hypothetical protein
MRALLCIAVTATKPTQSNHFNCSPTNIGEKSMMKEKGNTNGLLRSPRNKSRKQGRDVRVFAIGRVICMRDQIYSFSRWTKTVRTYMGLLQDQTVFQIKNERSKESDVLV